MFIEIPRMLRSSARVEQSFPNEHGEPFEVFSISVEPQMDYVNVQRIEAIYDMSHEYYEDKTRDTPYMLEMTNGNSFLTTKAFIKELLD